MFFKHNSSVYFYQLLFIHICYNCMFFFCFFFIMTLVSRMIKYTGFGNAAGMFASRNLLADAAANRDYSSDSENSETEEYRECKNQ